MHPLLANHLDAHQHVASTHDVLRWHTSHGLRTMLGNGELVRVWRGVFSNCVPEPNLAIRLHGLDLALGFPVAVCSHTAAELHGFAVDLAADVHVLAGRPRAGAERPGVVVHRGLARPLCAVGGRACTSVPWTAVDVARSLSRPRALATLDSALRTGRCTVGDLADVVQAQRGLRGVAKLGRLIEVADGLAESPMESEARLVLHDGGLPRPVLQHELRDRRGRVVHRLDMAWPWAKVAVEYSGVEWHSSRESLQRDHARAAWITGQGWRTLSLTLPDVRGHPSWTVLRVGQVLDLATR